MSYNLYIRKPKKGRLISPKIGFEEFVKAVESAGNFHVAQYEGESHYCAVLIGPNSNDKMILELREDGQIIVGWRMPIDYDDVFFVALRNLAIELNCELLDEEGKKFYVPV
ncbi:MAG: hypothetical protein NXI20_18300 [bacterium]|nr:hypothetical protein [bacterium]